MRALIPKKSLLNLLLCACFFLSLRILHPKQNVLRALEQSRATVRDCSTKAVTEAHLRAELSLATGKRDEAVSAAAESQRKAVLLQEQIQNLKLKLSRATQEKLKLERDSVRLFVVLVVVGGEDDNDVTGSDCTTIYVSLSPISLLFNLCHAGSRQTTTTNNNSVPP